MLPSALSARLLLRRLTVLKTSSTSRCLSTATPPVDPAKPRSSPTPPASSSSASSSASSSSAPGSQHDDKPHSQSNPSSLRDDMYRAILKRVPDHGWTSLAVDAGLRDLNLSLASAGVLPSGIASIAADFESRCNRRLAAHLAALNQTQVTSVHRPADNQHANTPQSPQQSEPRPSSETHSAATDRHEKDQEDPKQQDQQPIEPPHENTPPTRAAYAIQYRLSLLDPYHQYWYQAVSLRPRLPRQTLRSRLLLADEIAAYAQYNSPNMSWYTDRMVMATIYQAAELYWLTDSSPDRRNTKSFIHHRLDDAHGMRERFSSSFSNVMAVYDATTATASTLFRASRSSY